MDTFAKDWVVVRLRSGTLRLVEAVVLPVKSPGKVLVPVLPDAEAAEVDRVVNASSFSGTKHSARFRSGLPCIRCDGARRAEPLGVALLRDAGRTLVGTIRTSAPDAWEYRIAAAEGAEAGSGESGRAATASAAFDAILAIAAQRGWTLDAKPSPILDAAA
jgi:hypothetical protein